MLHAYVYIVYLLRYESSSQYMSHAEEYEAACYQWILCTEEKTHVILICHQRETVAK